MALENMRQVLCTIRLLIKSRRENKGEREVATVVAPVANGTYRCGARNWRLLGWEGP